MACGYYEVQRLMILGIVIACEIGFWAVIVVGLVVRYTLSAKRLGLLLIAVARSLNWCS